MNISEYYAIKTAKKSDFQYRNLKPKVEKISIKMKRHTILLQQDLGMCLDFIYKMNVSGNRYSMLAAFIIAYPARRFIKTPERNGT